MVNSSRFPGRIKRNLKPRKPFDFDWDKFLGSDDDAVRPGPSARSADPSPTSNTGQIAALLEHIAEPGQLFCLWAKPLPPDKVQQSGYYTSTEDLLQEISRLDGQVSGLYLSVNPIAVDSLTTPAKQQLNGQVSNFVKPPRAEHIRARKWLFLDIDPVRPADLSATSPEKKLARKKADEIVAFLKAEGWPDPIFLDSGSGCHILYKVDLAADDPIVKKLLAVLHERFSDDGVNVDEMVSPPNRVVRIPGTMNRKGESTPERPHRRARIVSMPKSPQLVSRKLLETLAKPSGAEKKAPVAGRDQEVVQRARQYLRAMAPAVEGQQGSLKALAAARAIVVNFGIAWESEEAWQLLLEFNERCVPPWKPNEYQDLRRKLQESYDWAAANKVDIGTSAGRGQRDLPPLPGVPLPLAVPDYAWGVATCPTSSSASRTRPTKG